MENPGALAGATGANEKADKLRSKEYPQRRPEARPVPLPGVWNSARFGWLRVIRKSNLSPNAKVLACCSVHDAADRLSGACHWHRSHFAEACGYSEDTVKRMFRELEEAGFLIRTQARRRGSRRRLVFMVPGDLAASVHRNTHEGPLKGGQSCRETAAEPVQSAPFSSGKASPQKAVDTSEKGCSAAPPILIPKKFQNTREPAREANPPRNTARHCAGTPAPRAPKSRWTIPTPPSSPPVRARRFLRGRTPRMSSAPPPVPSRI